MSIICFHNFPTGKQNDFIEQPKRMSIDAVSGALTINNVTMADQDTMTCEFIHSKKYVASVHIKIKGRF